MTCMVQAARPAGETAHPEPSQVFTRGKRGLSYYSIGIVLKFETFQKRLH